MAIFTRSFSTHLLFATLILIKSLIIVFSDCNQESDGRFWHPFQYSFNVNPDELDIASVALNYNQGFGFAANKSYYARHDKQITAWRTSFPVFMHIFFQRVYLQLFPQDTIELSYQHPYFQLYGLLLQLLNIGLSWIALYYFYELAHRLLKNHRLALGSTLVYAFIPSVCYYVGSMACYENTALPLMVITLAIYHRYVDTTKPVSARDILISCLCASVATLIRPHTTLIFFAYAGMFLMLAFLKKYIQKQRVRLRSILLLAVGNVLVMLLIQFPIMYKNYTLFGHYFISNQSSFSLLLGHNEYARGSWLGDSGVGSKWDQYIVKQIPGIEHLNEYEEAQARKRLALQWIRDNPGKELVLTARKIAIFFLPDNFLHPQEFFKLTSFFNALLHIGFITSFIGLFFRFLSQRRIQLVEELLIYIPVGSALLFSMMYYIDHRWRYYAEPYMLLITISLVLGWYKKPASQKATEISAS